MSIRGNQADRRRDRQSNPYYDHAERRSTSMASRAQQNEPSRKKHDCCLKFLLNNLFAGVLIGSGGSLIKELMEITQAEVHVSNATDFYPGTNLRCIYITGSEASVNLAQSLIWEMIGQQTYAQNENNRSLAWHPTVAKNNPGEYDQIEVEGKLTFLRQRVV